MYLRTSYCFILTSLDLKIKKNQDKLIENDLWSSEIINMQTQKNCESPKIETVSITHQFDKKYIK